MQQRRIWWLSLGFVLIAGMVVFSRPAYQKIKDFRATQIANNALEAYLKRPTDPGTVRKSVDQAKSSLFLSPTNFAANRALATLSMFSEPAVSLLYWEQSLELTKDLRLFEPRDRIHFVQVLILNGQFERAREMLESMETDAQLDASIDYNLAKVCQLLGDRNAALYHARQMIINRFTPIAHHLFYINLCLISEESEIRNEGERHLRFLLKNEELMDDSVVWQMSQFSNLSEASSELLNATLDKRVTDYEERIAFVDYGVKNGSRTKEQGLAELVKQLSPSDELAVIRLAQWCDSQGLMDEVIELMNEEIAMKRKDWLLLYLKNLGLVGDWESVLRLLSLPKAPIEEFASNLMKAEAFLAQGNRVKATSSWYRARLSSNPLPGPLWMLVRTGDKLGLKEDTERLLRELVIVGVDPEVVLAYVAEREFAKSDYDAFYRILSGFRELYSNIDTIVNDWAYYSILLGRDAEEAMLQVERLIGEHPNHLRYHMTWALGKIKAGQFRDVLARFQQFEIDWMSLHPQWRFILALALAGVGEYEQGKAYLHDIDVQSFNSYELELYENLFYGN